MVRDVLKMNPITLYQPPSTFADSRIKYKLKLKLYNMMQASRSFLDHEKHLTLYNALINLMDVDEANVQGNKDTKKIRHDKQDPPVDADKVSKKRKRKDADSSSSKKAKTQSKSSKESKTPTKPSATDKVVEDKELIQDDVEDDDEMEPNANHAPEQPWFNEMMNTKKDPVTFDDLMGSTVDVTKFSKNRLKKDKLTKADLVGPAFKLLKGGFNNSIELEYNMDQSEKVSFHVEEDRCDIAGKTDNEELRVFCWWKKNQDGLQTANADRMTFADFRSRLVHYLSGALYHFTVMNGNPSSVNIKQHCGRFQDEEKYKHVGPKTQERKKEKNHKDDQVMIKDSRSQDVKDQVIKAHDHKSIKHLSGFELLVVSDFRPSLILKNGPLFIWNNPLVLKKWHPDENLMKEDISIVPVWVKLHGVPVTAFSEDGLSAFATKVADVELKDNIVVVMPKLTGEGHYICNVRVEYEWKPPRCASCKIFRHIHEECPKNTGVGEKKTMKSSSQTFQGVSIGPKMGFKPQKEYRPVLRMPTASSSSNMKKGVVPTIEVSNSNPFEVLNSVDNDMELGTNEGTTNLLNNEATSSGSSFMNIDNSNTRTTPIIDKIGKFEELCHTPKISEYNGNRGSVTS
ncbi:RNA-directed DNA polymerase, eukaryota, reverse transcriptase zinc-binding domain protein [Tanacetum coccineum]